MKSFLVCLAFFLSTNLWAADHNPFTSIKVDASLHTIFTGGEVIWGFDFTDTTHLIFTQRKGEMKILNILDGKIQNIANVPEVFQGGQGGLLDIVVHPHFKDNNFVYFSYSINEGKNHETRITRATLKNNKLENLKVLFTSNSEVGDSIHFGSRIVFDRKGHIFFSVGDRGHREFAQDLTKAAGKTFRLKEDGEIPSDNPFFKHPTAIKSIWSYGHRNPQGMYFDLKTDTLWESEHGPRGGDEINRVEKGKNYGWPIITYGREYYGPKIGEFEKKGMEQPFYYYVPSIAPSSLTMHEGHFYSGALVLTHLNRLILKDGKFVREERLLESQQERIRNVKTGMDGFLYASTDSGKILQIKIK